MVWSELGMTLPDPEPLPDPAVAPEPALFPDPPVALLPALPGLLESLLEQPASVAVNAMQNRGPANLRIGCENVIGSSVLMHSGPAGEESDQLRAKKDCRAP